MVVQVIEEGGMYQLTSNLEYQGHILNVYSYNLLGYPGTVSSIKSFGSLQLKFNIIEMFLASLLLCSL